MIKSLKEAACRLPCSFFLTFTFFPFLFFIHICSPSPSIYRPFCPSLPNLRSVYSFPHLHPVPQAHRSDLQPMRKTVTTQPRIFPQDSLLTPISSSGFHFNLLGFQEDYIPAIKVCFHRPFFFPPNHVYASLTEALLYLGFAFGNGPSRPRRLYCTASSCLPLYFQPKVPFSHHAHQN